MAVYPYCKKCACRRDAAQTGGVECADKSAHKKSVMWRADVNFGTGTRLRKFFTTKENAETQERQWLTDDERGTLLPKDQQPDQRFGDLADKYWDEHVKTDNHKPERTTYYLVQFLKERVGRDRKIGPLNDGELQAFQNDLRQLQRTLRSEGRAGATVNRIFNVLRAIFKKGKEWGVIKIDPSELISRMQEEEPAIRFLEIAEIEKLRRAIETLPEYVRAKNLKERRSGNNRVPEVTPEQVKRLHNRVLVYLHTGARPSSQADCNWSNGDVDLSNRIIWFTTYKGGKRNKKHRYPHPIDNELYQVLLERAKVTNKRGPVFDVTGIRELETLAIEASGINEGKQPRQEFSMYGLKHCYASHLLMSGASLLEVAKLLGHTDTRMVEKHYGHLTLGHLRKVQEKVNLTPPLMEVI